MKKTLIWMLTSGLIFSAGLKAQTLQEGITHLSADRFKSAENVFQKLLQVNPNNIEATYWLGQTYLDWDENEKARDVYTKGLASSNNAPLLQVGAGHVDLLEGKTADARQKFESALSLTRNPKKGDDPQILYAIGRANVDAKQGDVNYAIEKLETASQKDAANPEVFLQLGNAYRKARPGEGGGQAYTNYNKALQLNPNFVVAYIRLAKLFETQRNWELVLDYLNKAITQDPKFSPAYYELFYYYFYRLKFDEAEGYMKKYIDSRAPDTYIEDQYLYAQLCWARKDFTCAIAKASGVETTQGEHTKPKVFKLLADAYYQSGDSIKAKEYIDKYFAKEKNDGADAYAIKIRAKIYSKFPGNEEVAFGYFMEAVKSDTLVDGKIETIKEAAAKYKAEGKRDKEASFLMMLLEVKPKPNINDYFDPGRAYYFAKNYPKSYDVFNMLANKYPEEVFGWEWLFNNARVMDTVRKDSIAVPAALKLFDFSQRDTLKFRKQIISSASYLAIYYANDAKDRDKALDYMRRWQSADTANRDKIGENIKKLESAPKAPATQPARTNNARTGSPKPLPAIKPKTSTAMKKPAVKHV